MIYDVSSEETLNDMVIDHDNIYISANYVRYSLDALF